MEKLLMLESGSLPMPGGDNDRGHDPRTLRTYYDQQCDHCKDRIDSGYDSTFKECWVCGGTWHEDCFGYAQSCTKGGA